MSQRELPRLRLTLDLAGSHDGQTETVLFRTSTAANESAWAKAAAWLPLLESELRASADQDRFLADLETPDA